MTIATMYYVAKIGPVKIGSVSVLEDGRYLAAVVDMPVDGAIYASTLDEGKLFVASIFAPEVRQHILWQQIY